MQAAKEIYQKPTLVGVRLTPGENVLAGGCQDGTAELQYDLGKFCDIVCDESITSNPCKGYT